jgi:multidrug efflux system membrane fusion protein
VVFTLPADSVPTVQKRVHAGAQLPTIVLDRTRTTTLGDGQFLTLDNQIDAATGTVRAKARFDNAEGTLFPNQFVNVQLQLDVVKQALVVPAAAIRHGPEGTFVYVVDAQNTAHVRLVKTGPSVDDRTAVTSGLQDGERVVTEGGDRLTDGSVVRLPGQADAAGWQRGQNGQGGQARGHRQQNGQSPRGQAPGGAPPSGAQQGGRRWGGGRQGGSPESQPSSPQQSGSAPPSGAPQGTSPEGQQTSQQSPPQSAPPPRQSRHAASPSSG